MAIQVTSRRVGKIGAILLLIGLALLTAYAATGFYLAPYWIRTQILPGVSKIIGARLSAERIAIDPFRLTMVIQRLSLQDQSGVELADFQRLSTDIAGWQSLRQRRLVISGQLVGAAVRPKLDTQGRFNFAAFFPSRKAGDAPLPFLVTRFTVEHSRVEFEDRSRDEPYRKILEEVALNLQNLGAEPEGQATYSFSARSDKRESLSAAGTFSTSPFTAEGRLRLSDVDLAPLLDYWMPGSSWRLRSGKADAKADYQLRVGNQTAFEIRGGEGRGEGLQWASKEDDQLRLRIASLSVGGFAYSLAEGRLTLQSAMAEDAVTPSLKADSLSTQGFSWSLAEQRFNLDVLAVQNVTTSPTRSDGNLSGTDHPRNAAGGVAAATDLEPPRINRIGNLRASGIDGSLTQRSVAVDTVAVERAEIEVQRLPDGSMQMDGLPTDEIHVAGKDRPAWHWHLRIAEIGLDHAAVGFRDEAVTPPVRLDFTPVTLRLTDFNTERGSRFQFRVHAGMRDTGKIELDGQARLVPLEVDLRFGVDQLQLRSLQPYWQNRTGVDLVRGQLNLWGDITVRRDPDWRLDYSGGADIVHLATLDKTEAKPLIRWDSLKFDQLVIHTRPKRFAVRTVTAEQPYARVVIAADGSFNLAKELVRRTANSPTPPAEPWSVVAGLLRVQDGRMDFADLSWKPGYATEIRSLDGIIGGLSSRGDARANVLFEGRSDQDARVKIAGQINPFQWANHTDVTMEFRGVNLTTLSPYASRFAGYRIEKGKLDMNLRYQVHNRKLAVENRMVLDQLVLGERVDPKATTWPVDLAVALLKDGDGRIDLDLPISGNLDDPQFSLGNLYGNAVNQLMSKLVSSPFTLLSNLVKSGDEDLGYVTFRPGDVSLMDGEKTKLAKVAGALKARPALKLDIKGSADPQQDRLALAERALLKQLNQAWRIELRSLGKKTSASAELDLADEDYRRLFTEFCRHRHPNLPELRILAGTKPKVLQGALFERAKRQVLEQWAINELDLRQLAQARSNSIRDFLVRESGLADQRIYLLDVKLDQPEDRTIKALLSVSGS